MSRALELIFTSRVENLNAVEHLDGAVDRVRKNARAASDEFALLKGRLQETTGVANHAAGEIAGLVAALGAATIATTSHAAAADHLVNVYRGVRLALSPTTFTAYTLGLGAATEALIKLTNAQARLNEQNAIRAGSNGLGFNEQYLLSLIQNRQAFNFDAAFKAFQGNQLGGVLQFGEALKRLGDIKDPIDRVRESIRIFGHDVGEQILPQLNERFLLNQQRIQEWGIGIDKVGRENIQRFKDDFHNLFLSFKEDGDALVLIAKKVALGLSEGVADTYVALKRRNDALAGAFQNPRFQPGQYQAPLPLGGLFLDNFDVAGAAADTPARQRLSEFLSTPGITAQRSFDIRGILAAGDRDREKSLLESRIRQNEEFFLHPQDTKQYIEERPIRQQQLATDAPRLKAINDQIQAEKDAKTAAEDAAQSLRNLGEELRTLKQRAALEGLSGGTLALAENQQTVDNLAHQYGSLFTPGVRARVGALLFPKVTAGFTSDALQASREEGDRTLQGIDAARLYGLTPIAGFSGLNETLKQFNENAKEQIRIDREVRTVGLNAQREALIRTAGRQQALTEIGADPGTEGAAVAANRAYQVRLGLAKQLLELDVEAASKEQDAGQRRVEMARAEADYTRQAAEAAIDREVKLAEIQKKRVDEFKNLATGFVNAAQSHSLPGFFRQQGQRLEDQIVGNAAEMAFKFIPSLSVSKDPNSLVGKLLAGTPFAGNAFHDTAVKAAQDTAANTQATATGVAAIYSAITGQVLPGMPNGVAGIGSATLGGFGGIPGFSIPGLTTNGGAFESGTSIGGALSSVSRIAGLLKPISGVSSSNGDDLLPGLIGVTKGQLSSTKENPFHALFNSDDSTSSRIGAGVAIAGAGFGAYTGISQAAKGGARNIIGGIGTTLASIAPLTGPAAPFLLAAGLGANLISSFFGDPKAIRQRDINRRLAADQFYEPVAINATMGTDGSAVSTDRYGNVQSNDTSPFPVVQEPYADLRNGITVPGRTLSPIGGPSGVNPGPTSTTINIHTWDSQSMDDFLKAHSDRLAGAVALGMNNGGSGGEHLANSIAQRN